MIPAYEPFEMVQRHGVGNILRLLWAYTLHRGSERLAHAARRVMTRAGSFERLGAQETYRVDLSSEYYLPDLDEGIDEVLMPQQRSAARSMLDDRGGVSVQHRAEARHLSKSAAAQHPLTPVYEPTQPEPWFRALQTAHRAEVAAGQEISAPHERARVFMNPRVGDHLPEPVHQVAEEIRPIPSERLRGMEEPHAMEESERVERKEDILETLDERAGPVPENRAKTKIPLPDPTCDEAPVWVANTSERITAELELGTDVRVERMEPDVTESDHAVSEQPEPEMQRSMTCLSDEPLERWPMILAESNHVSMPRSEETLVPTLTPARRHRAQPSEVADGRVRQSSSSDRIATIAASAQRAAQWDEFEGEWPLLPDATTPRSDGREMERYRRDQRRWDEQRGIL